MVTFDTAVKYKLEAYTIFGYNVTARERMKRLTISEVSVGT